MQLLPSLTSARTLVLVTILLVAATPTSLAQDAEQRSSEVSFYGHIFGIGRGAPMPMNTQFPTGEADLSQGFIGHNCGITPQTVDTPAGTVAGSCEEDTQNEEWFYSTAGFVQIKKSADFDYKKLHNERGLTKDTSLDTGKSITASFYMSGDYHGWPVAACSVAVPDVPWPVPCWQWDPGYLPQWQVEATVYTGILGEYGGAATEQPDIAGAFAAGKLKVLATGVSTPQDIQSLEPLGQPTVWKFDIDLGPPQRSVISKEESYVVRFQWWGVKADGSQRIFPQTDVWNVNGGEHYPPVIRIPVKGAFNVEMVVPQFVYDKLVILGIMNTPWGSYDVDQDSIKLTIADSAGRTFDPRHISRLADFSVAHEGHYKPVNITYVWDYKADQLPPGDYTVTVSGANYQGSAAASCQAKFKVLAQGRPGDITVGQCGVRTISDDQLSNIKQGSARDASNSRGSDVPLPRVGLQSAAIEPISTSPVALVGLAFLAMAFVARRWRS